MQVVYSEVAGVPVTGFRCRAWEWERECPTPKELGGDPTFTVYVHLRIWMNEVEGKVHAVSLKNGWRHRGHREKAVYDHPMIPLAYVGLEVVSEVRAALVEAASTLKDVLTPGVA